MTKQEILNNLKDLQTKLASDNSSEIRDVKALISLIVLTVENNQERFLRATILEQFEKLLSKGSSQN